jgi:signal transduction histidine kinase
MESLLRLPQQVFRSRRLPLLIIGLTLAVFGGAIWLGAIQLRKNIRAQIVGRDADILYAVLRHHLSEYEDAELGDDLEDSVHQLTVALEISRLKGVIATRLFDASGAFTLAFPPHVTSATLDTQDFANLARLKPGSRFHGEAALAPFTAAPLKVARETSPLLEVNIPVHRTGQSNLLGIAQFTIDGETIANDFRALDRSLATQGAAVFVLGGLIIAVALAWAFRRVVERTEKLVRANEELALAAKTSAVGAVTAHLIHRLSNPLAGVRNFITTHAGGAAVRPSPASETDWHNAATATREMQNLIAEIIHLLGEEQTIGRYEVTFAEIAELIGDRVRPVARAAGVRFAAEVKAEGILGNRDAGLAILILENLIRNAIEATPRGRTVALVLDGAQQKLSCEVRDEGPGIPESVRPNLFTPCRSGKAGGHGIGLAICKQLSNHLGASLELRDTSPSGSIFVLTVALANTPEKDWDASRVPAK